MQVELAAGLGLGGAVALLTLVWLLQLRTRDAGLVDVVWSAAVGGLGVFYALAGSAPAVARVALGVFAGLWGARLALHLALRMRGQPEDRRYAAARQQWGARADTYMLLFFWFQALVAWVLTLPLLVVAYRPEAPAVVWIALAVILWVVAVGGEALADTQLERCKRDPAMRGKVCNKGLWRYSRHPNYFFECLHWTSYIPLAIGAPWWWATLAPPLLMAWLLLKVSGIPTLESAQGMQRREGYDEYVRTTSAFIPLPPKKN